MARSTRVHLFGDQMTGFDGGLRRLFQIQDNPLLSSFFERTHHALRLEIGQLSLAERAFFPRFTSISDLLARYRDSGNNPALESAFTCIHQLACFISYYGEGSEPYPSSTNSYIIGLCTGSLAAAAISCARTIAELLPIAIEAVLIAFRTGLRANEARIRLEPSSSASPSWSVMLSGIQEETTSAILKEFSRVMCLPVSSQPYISALNSNGVTISGPPRRLEELLQASSVKSLKPLRIPIHAPYHAAHLYTESDLDAILGPSSKENLSSHVPRIPVLSATTGSLLSASDYGSLLRVALREILREPLCWTKVLEGCTTVIKSSGSTQCDVLPVATNAAQSLVSALKEACKMEVKLDNVITAGPKKVETLPSGRNEQSKIAIVGLSGRFPDAASPELFWDLLYKGLDVHREIPKDRFDVNAYYDPTGKKKNTSQVKYGCFIEEPGLFDARFFNMSPREAAQSDPAQRLAIMTAYEALEMAGFVPNRTPSSQRDRVGLFYGVTSDDWREVNSGQNVDTYFIPGGNRAFTPGRINYHFKFSGPSFSVDTACSSSLAALHMACNSLWRGDCDTALAGGTNVMTNPDNFAGLDRGHFLSHTGNCNTFDDAANGYCRADGVGTVVLKRLEDALADNDPIQAVILGAYTNHSAEAVSITRPEAGAQSFIFDKILNAAHVDPFDISYIEMHGTGTQAGDGVEMRSVLDVFSPAHRKRSADQSLHLGSAKANIGHGESASGVTSLVKILLMMQKNLIPPHCGIKTKINHTFPTDLKERNVHIAMKPTPWARPVGGKRRVFLNNFSAAGGNTAVLLEDAPAPAVEEDSDPRSIHMVAVSAKSISSLKKNIQSLVTFIDEEHDLSLPSLSYTTTARRMHHNHRIVVSGSDLQKIKDELKASALREDILPVPASSPNAVFAFTGQGSHYAGMGRQLFENFAQFRSDIRRFDSIGQSQGFPTILPLIDGTVTDIKGLSPVIVQLGAICMQMALARLWTSWGVKPSLVVGHSLGEYAALNFAGVLSTSDTIYLTGKRAQLLEERCSVGTHLMLAVKASVSALQSHLADKVHEIACINAPEETVISGTTRAIEALSDDLTACGFKCTKLNVPFAFHSSQVQPILESFEAAAQGVIFHEPSVPVISPLLGEVVTSAGTFGPSYLSRHCREAVNFLNGIESARNTKLVTEKTVWLEVGSHPVCSGMVKATFGPKVTALPSLRRNEDTWKVLAGSLSALHLSGIELQWGEYHRDFKSSHKVLRLPAYSWDYKNYWIQYVHDWCLTKGDAPSPAIPATVPEAVPLKSLSDSVQSIVEERAEANTATVVMESDISKPALEAVFQGHKVNGSPICTSSVYADIALTLGDYLRAQFKPDMKKTAMDICNMVTDKSLIYKDQGKQLFRASAVADWTTETAVVEIYSVTNEGKKTLHHADCTIKYADGESWQQEWKRNAYMVKNCIKTLHNGVNGGQSHKIKRGMAYKLFGALVQYDQKFKGMEEVVLDSSQLESTARVVFQATEKDGNFYFCPYWIDSCGQLSGFTMNANDNVDSKVEVFINHGWESMKCSQKFSADKTYQTYVKMQPVGKTMFAGDVYIFEDDNIIAIFQGIKFQGVPRRVLDAFMPPAGAPKAAPGPAEKAIPRGGPQLTKPKPTPVSNAKPSAATPVPTKSNGPSIITRAMNIVAEEIGVTVAELSDNSNFADFGVDSLLSLTIAGKFREELDMDVESSVFVECPTVKDLKAFLAQQSPTEQDSVELAKVSDVEGPSVNSSSSATECGSVYTDDGGSVTSVEDDDVDTMAFIRATLAEEIGVSKEEITGSTNLAELGMDSLLSLTVLGKLRETLSIDLPSDLFVENTTLDAVEAVLGLKPKAAPAPRKVEKEPSSAKPRPPPASMPPATSILLQGNPKTAKKTLFLFPDGSGSSTSYAVLSRIGSDIAVYGLNCPYMKTPQDLKCSLEGLTAPYLAEVRRRQPKGPYYLSGWSAGGICAYDAAQQLIKEGEEVARLILLDSPFPIGLEKLPPRLYHFFNSIGMFGAGKKAPPEWLLPHFLAFIDALDSYKAVPFAAGTAPKTWMIWAKDGVCKRPGDPRPTPQPDDPKEMIWLLENRTDLGPNGWDRLLGGRQNLTIEAMDDANHFSMMEGQKAKELSDFIGRAMA